MAKKKAKKTSASKKKVRVQKSARTVAPVMPLGDRVLLKPMSVEESAMKTVAGIIIPDTVSKEKPEQGTVIAVGPGKITDDGKLVPVSVKVGEKVVFSKYGYDEVKVDGVEYYLVSESNILAVINK